ncbi:cupin domain-containing protein [Cereibacter sphaeroides]|uniref:cupin domain-containing protein n=1 Tax=Cereibacter sphaeroides TaxID=1063 RepID=UPI00399087E0
MNSNHLIGQRLRQIRKNLALSLSGLSERSGVSVGTLSQLERGLGRPSLRTIERISQALGVPPFWLLEMPDQHNPEHDQMIVRSGQGVQLTVTEPGMTKTLVTPRSFDAMQLMTVVMEPGSKSGAGFYRHEGIDVGYILSGSLNLEVDGRTHVLSAGDCFAFDSQLPHRFENRGGSRAEVLWINTKSRLNGLPPLEPATAEPRPDPAASGGI